MITLTETAARNFKRIREDEELSEDVPLRVSVKGGGCAGYEYILDFGESTKRDLTFVSEGLPIVIDKKSHIVVDGLEIDWSKDSKRNYQIYYSFFRDKTKQRNRGRAWSYSSSL
jgi:iron-sulfur cluster assembly protein